MDVRINPQGWTKPVIDNIFAIFQRHNHQLPDNSNMHENYCMNVTETFGIWN